MNLGEWLLFLALTGWFASPALLLCTALGSLAHHVFVVRWEEPKLLARFGDEYARYRATVNRWLPKAPNARMC
jgi:protein-S-isoprenylcysteine O-methyltransferase Ste14